MYRELLPVDRWKIRIIHSLAWVFILVGGVLGLISPSLTMLREVGPIFITISGIFLILGGIVAISGTLRDSAYGESIGGYAVAAGLSVYILAIWVSSIDLNSQWMGAALMTACLFLTLGRVTLCGIHIKKLKAVAAANRKEKQ